MTAGIPSHGTMVGGLRPSRPRTRLSVGSRLRRTAQKLTRQEATIVATTNDLKNGTVLKIDGQLWTVIEFQHVKPGKGGAFVRTKLKNVLSGKVVDRTFNAGLKVETANVDKRDMQYLYKDGTDFVFMDTDNYDQIHISEATVGDVAHFLLENQNAMVATNEGVPLYVELPPSVDPRGHLHRAGPAGRPLVGRHQARDAGDRLRDPGAAVPRGQHEGQGGHPRRELPRPCERLRWALAPRPASGPSTSSSRPTSAAIDPVDPAARTASPSPAPRRRCRSTPSTWSRG